MVKAESAKARGYKFSTQTDLDKFEKKIKIFPGFADINTNTLSGGYSIWIGTLSWRIHAIDNIARNIYSNVQIFVQEK